MFVISYNSYIFKIYKLLLIILYDFAQFYLLSIILFSKSILKYIFNFIMIS